MSKHSKRFERARNNPKDVSYEDFISMLEKEGYTIIQSKGSHMKAEKSVADEMFRLIFARPHGKHKSMHANAVTDMLSQLVQIAELESDDAE